MSGLPAAWYYLFESASAKSLIYQAAEVPDTHATVNNGVHGERTRSRR